MSEIKGTLTSHLWSSSDLYRNAVLELNEAAVVMNLDPNIAERLKFPKRAMIVSVPIRLDDGSIRVFEGYRVQHNNARGPLTPRRTMVSWDPPLPLPPVHG